MIIRGINGQNSVDEICPLIVEIHVYLSDWLTTDLLLCISPHLGIVNSVLSWQYVPVSKVLAC